MTGISGIRDASLRDVRRVFAAIARGGSHLWCGVRRADGVPLPDRMIWWTREGPRKMWPLAQWIAEIDRLIGRHGPTANFLDTISAAHPSRGRDPVRRRPKGTDEVAPQGSDPQEDAQRHGGDGASGEVETPAQPAGGKDGEGDGSGSPPAAGESADAPGMASSGPGDGAGGTPSGPPHASQRTSAATHTQGHPPPDADALRVEGDHPATPDAATPSDASRLAYHRGPHREPLPAARPDSSHTPADAATLASADTRHPGPRGADLGAPSGGADGTTPPDSGQGSHVQEVTATEDATAQPADSPAADPAGLSPPDEYIGRPHGWGGDHTPSRTERERARRAIERDPAVRRAARALDRLVRATARSSAHAPSPRVDGRRLVRELASRRVSLGAARRRELAPALVLLAVDVSGSCCHCAPAYLACAEAVALRRPECVLLLHSNGFPEGRLDRRLPPWERDGDEVAWWRSLSALRPAIGLAVVAGDADAAHGYQALAEAGTRLVWLDDYGCKSGVRPGSRDHAGCAGWRRAPLAVWAGVSTPGDVAHALESTAKNSRGSVSERR